MDKTADELMKAAGESLVVCGSNSIADQAMVCAINQMLGNVGKTVDIESYSYQRRVTKVK
jgi:hypothetical protein